MNKKSLLLSTSLIIILYSVLIILFVNIFPQNKDTDLAKLFTEHYNNKISSFEEENNLYKENQVDVIFIGDSLTELYDVKKYYPEYVVLNRGIGGDTTIGLERRLKVSLYELKPKVVVMLIGANNIYQMMDNYEHILIDLKQNLGESKIILLSLTAMGGPHWGKANHQAAYNNVLIKKLANKYNYTFIDLYTPLMDETTKEVYDGFTVDGGHFTEVGYDVITSLIKPTIDQILEK